MNIVSASQVRTEKALNDLRDNIVSESQRKNQLNESIRSSQATLSELQARRKKQNAAAQVPTYPFLILDPASCITLAPPTPTATNPSPSSTSGGSILQFLGITSSGPSTPSAGGRTRAPSSASATAAAADLVRSRSSSSVIIRHLFRLLQFSFHIC